MLSQFPNPDATCWARPCVSFVTHLRYCAVINTNIAPECLAACFEQCRLFFALPDSQKQQILADQNNRGYTPYQEETLNPGTQSEGDTKEGLYFGRDIPRCSPEAAKPLHGPNQWPDAAVLPAFRPAVQAYFEACTQLGFRCAQLGFMCHVRNIQLVLQATVFMQPRVHT